MPNFEGSESLENRLNDFAGELEIRNVLQEVSKGEKRLIKSPNSS